MTSRMNQHVDQGGGQLVTQTSRLCLAPDDHSGIWGTQANRTAPLPWLVTRINARPVPQTVAKDFYGWPTHTRQGVDMQKSTRGPDLVDSRPDVSGVKITPPMYAAPVTTTHTVA